MVHKKTENQVKYMLADTILALCGSTISYEAEVRVEGLLGITIDDQEVFLVQINKSMRKGTPRSPRKSERATKTDKGGKSEKKAAGEKSAKKAADKADKPAEKSTERPKKDGGQADSSLTRQSRRKRKATWKVKLNMGEDHDYISSPEKDAKKRKQKTAAELGLVALDSSDSEDDNAGGDVAEESRDGDEENVLVEQEVVYVNDGGRSSKSGPAPSDSSDDDDYDVGQSMPDLEPLDSSEGDGALAAMGSRVVAEVVHTGDGNMALQLTSGGQPVKSAFETTYHPYHEGDASKIEYKIVKGGSIRGSDMLTDSIGYSYVSSGKKKDRKDMVPYWRCSVRGTAGKMSKGDMYCRATVNEENGVYRRSEVPHNHPPKEGIYGRLMIGKMIRDQAQRIENATVPASQVFEKAMLAMMEADPTLSHEWFMERSQTFMRRFSRHRKEFLAKQGLPPDFKVRKLVKRTPKSLKKKAAQASQQQYELENPPQPGSSQEFSQLSETETVMVPLSEGPYVHVVTSQPDTALQEQVHLGHGDQQIVYIQETVVDQMSNI